MKQADDGGQYDEDDAKLSSREKFKFGQLLQSVKESSWASGKLRILARESPFAAMSRRMVPAFLRHGYYWLGHRVAQAIRYESETAAKFQVLPIAFGFGILAYFSLPREPQLIAIMIALGVAVWMGIKAYGTRAGNFALVAVCIFGGMTAGKMRVNFLDTKMIERPVQARITGIVLNQEQRGKGRRRYTIQITGFDGRTTIIPEVIRASVTIKYPPVEIGEGISGRVRLRPPSGPAYPGSYDFAFQSWFSGIGANGFFLGAPKMEKVEGGLPWSMRAGIQISLLRSNIAARLRETLPGEAGGLAAALIVGDRSGISKKTAEALRGSGLAHILAISGLHMALVTATVLFLVRSSLALVPGISLYYPIRKWAAVAAMVAVTLYLLISGASIATQRAWVMITIMLFAILRDRRALTMRNVALAALIVLLWRPEAIISPGFQMSFAAVAALIAVYESWSRFRRNRIYRQPNGRILPWISKMTKGVTSLAVTSIVAGVATGLYAAYHFNRIAPLGLVANLAAMPIVSIAVMPMALVSMVLMPFGLEGWPLFLMGMAIEQVVGIAQSVTDLGPDGNTGFLPLSSVLFGTLALIVATQLKSGLRWIGVPMIGLAMMSYSARQPPDILVSESGESIAVRGNDGLLKLMRPRKEKFITSNWKKAFAPTQLAMESDKKKKSGNTPFHCDDLGCTIPFKGLTLAWVKRPQAFLEDCLKADIIVTRLNLPSWCNRPKLIITREMLQGRGSHALTISNAAGKSDKPAIIVKTAYGQFRRPWSRGAN